MGSFSYSQTNKNKISLSKVNFNNNNNFVSSNKTTDFEEIDYTKSDKKYEVLLDGVPTYVDNLDDLPDDQIVVTDPVHQFNSLNDLPEKPDISSFDEMDETQQMAVNLFNYLNAENSNSLKEYLEKAKDKLERLNIPFEFCYRDEIKSLSGILTQINNKQVGLSRNIKKLMIK